MIKFPKGGMLVHFTLNDQTEQILHKGYKEVTDVPVLGLANSKGGRIAVFGDSTCLDSSHTPIPCFWLLEYILQYVFLCYSLTLRFTCDGHITNELQVNHKILRENWVAKGARLPLRLDSRLLEYSKVSDPSYIVSASPLPRIYANGTNAHGRRNLMTTRKRSKK